MSTQEGYLGIRERFIEIEENTYGVAPAFTNARVPGTDIIITPTFTQGFQETLNNGSDSRSRIGNVKGPLSLNYKMEYFPSNWSMLKYVFDIDSETGSNPYTHTLSLGNTLKSFSTEWARRHDTDPLIYHMVGNVIKQFTVDFSKTGGEGRDGFIKCTADVLCKDYSEETLTTGTFLASGDPFQYRHSLVTLESTAVVPVNSGQFVINQNISDNDSRYANSSLDRTIGQPIAQLVRISGRLNLNLFETTFHDIWATATALTGTNTFTFEQDSGNKITFTFTGMYVEAIPEAGTNIEGINTGDFIFTADSVSVVAIDSIQNW